MHLRSIHLRDFRNFKDQEFSFCDKFNLLYGDNAQGKTNVLESIAVISSGRSFRTSAFRDMISWGCEDARISANIEGPLGSDSVVATLSHEEGKGFLKNGKRARPAGTNFILFAPEEILLLKDNPAARRKYIDRAAASYTPLHGKIARNYERTLVQRNKVLKDENTTTTQKRDLLKPWNEQVVKYGTELCLSRLDWLLRLSDELPDQYRSIAPKDGSAAFRYAPFCGEDALDRGREGICDFFAGELDRRFQDELIRGVTLVGPHRDDAMAHIGELEVKRFGSQGQHRSFVLSLKIAEVEMHKRDRGGAPILLLDDVASELDEARNRYFFEYLANSDGQVFITATSEDHILLTSTAKTSRFNISKGAVV